MHARPDHRWTSRFRTWLAVAGGLVALHAGSAHAAGTPELPGAAPRFALFESGQVRPLALSPGGRWLYAVNTPDSRLEIFRVTSQGLVHSASVTVGLEPVAVAARSDDEAWVVNHLSDSVSIVRHDQGGSARVVRTLLVGDEPRDIVFAGPQRRRAFITTAHRGQNDPDDPQLLTPGIGRADVWVFDAGNLGDSLGGTRLTKITLFTDTPRALAVTPDGGRVYAAGFFTGNRTTAVHSATVKGSLADLAGFLAIFAPGFPATNALAGPSVVDILGTVRPISSEYGSDPNNPLTGYQPITGVILKFDGQHWVDSAQQVWDQRILYSLPDKDVFAIDAMASPPRQLDGAAGSWSGVGTVLYDMVVNPANGKVYVANTDARNDVRFEGPGQFGGSTVRGHTHESRITVLSPGGAVQPRHLNKHIDYSVCCAANPQENAASLAFPQGMAIGADGKLYVAAFGSSKIGVFDSRELEDDTFVPNAASHIAVSGGGPTGLVLSGRRLYVMTRFDNGVSVIDTSTQKEVQHVALYNPEPPSVVAGRRFLYDAAYTSTHGDSACASCHVFGDFDGLAWDLGNPDGGKIRNPIPIFRNPGLFELASIDDAFMAMKGPMTTQSLRGMSNHGSMHWRGDRTGGNEPPDAACGESQDHPGYIASAQPDCGIFDEKAAFLKFNPAFEGLVGRSAPLAPSEMAAFADFILQVMYPPNPIRNLDNSLTADQAAGKDIFVNRQNIFADRTCESCHVLDPDGNRAAGVPFPGFFGTDGSLTFKTLSDALLPMAVKVPQLRNMYQKVGMFGQAPTGGVGGGLTTSFIGDQVRGFGYLNDGSIDTLVSFHSTLFFNKTLFGQPLNAGGFEDGEAGNAERVQVAKFLLAFDSNLAPIVGQQITATRQNGAVVRPRIDLLLARAGAGECEVVAKAFFGFREFGWLYDAATARFVADRQAIPAISAAALRLLGTLLDTEITYTCAPVGSGRRLGVDADLDGYLDGDEAAACSDPRDPSSTP